MIDNSIYIANVMFPDELCDAAINLFDIKEKAFRKSGMILDSAQGHFHKNIGTNERLDEGIYVDEMDTLTDIGNSDFISDINGYLNEAVQEYTSHFAAIGTMHLRSTRQKLQKTKPSGGYHLWHHEQATADSSERVLVWSIYLNDVEEGGETEFLYQSKRIKARKGKILIFPASFTHTHRGNPPLLDDKYILTGWWVLY